MLLEVGPFGWVPGLCFRPGLGGHHVWRALGAAMGLSELFSGWDCMTLTKATGSAPLGQVGREIRTHQGQLIEAGFVTTLV